MRSSFNLATAIEVLDRGAGAGRGNVRQEWIGRQRGGLQGGPYSEKAAMRRAFPPRGSIPSRQEPHPCTDVDSEVGKAIDHDLLGTSKRRGRKSAGKLRDGRCAEL